MAPDNLTTGRAAVELEELSMRTIRSILGMTVGLVLLTGIASAVVAAFAKQRLASSGTETDDEFELVTIFDGGEFTSMAPALRRGTVLTWYGGRTIDLRGATLDPAGAQLTIRAIFGGVQLLVPPSWQVDLQVIAILGGAGDTRDQALVDESGPMLRFVGLALCGGLGIMATSTEPEAETESPMAEPIPA
jgi:hypothetical protein